METELQNTFTNSLLGDLGLLLALLLLLNLSLLVEDLLGLPVADQEHHGGEDQDNGAPGGAVAKSELVSSLSTWNMILLIPIQEGVGKYEEENSIILTAI